MKMTCLKKMSGLPGSVRYTLKKETFGYLSEKNARSQPFSNFQIDPLTKKQLDIIKSYLMIWYVIPASYPVFVHLRSLVWWTYRWQTVDVDGQHLAPVGKQYIFQSKKSHWLTHVLTIEPDVARNKPRDHLVIFFPGVQTWGEMCGWYFARNCSQEVAVFCQVKTLSLGRWVKDVKVKALKSTGSFWALRIFLLTWIFVENGRILER